MTMHVLPPSWHINMRNIANGSMCRRVVLVLILAVAVLAVCVVTRRDLIVSCTSLGRLREPLEAEDPFVLNTLKDHFLLPPSSGSYNLTSIDDMSRKYHNLLGWDFIHRHVRQFFDQQRGGFFVEAGALDGQFFSNTLWLEQERGWTGLLIEPDALNFRHLQWRKRKAWISNSCIAPGQYPREAIFESMNIAEIDTKESLQWMYRSNAREFNNEFSSVPDEMSVTSFKSYSKVQCFPLASYLVALNVSTVDFLSLDIQGGEWEVIHSLPLARIAVRVMAVEYFNTRVDKARRTARDEAFVSYMKDLGYSLLALDDIANYIFFLDSDPALKASANNSTSSSGNETTA